jgi:transposase InsO family protein
VLTQLVSVHGAPRYLRSDNGPEFVAQAILRWLQTAQIETAFIDPGKPWQNGTDESFNGKLRDFGWTPAMSSGVLESTGLPLQTQVVLLQLLT